MRRRPAARLLVLDEQDRLLLFRFVYHDAVRGSQDYWATPAGAVEAGETVEGAARRELAEETGLRCDTLGPPIAHKEFVLPLPQGERVLAEEHYFLVRVPKLVVSREHWTAAEHDVMADHRWWSIPDLSATSAVIFPEDVVAMLARLGVQARE